MTAVVVMLALTGCGRDNARRQAVADYVDAVNRVETQLRKPLIELQHTNARFSTKTPVKTHAHAVHARQTIAQLQHVLQGLKPPRQAARLHARLLALVSAELSLAREVERLSLFLPGIQRALAPLPATQRKLNVATGPNQCRRRLQHLVGCAGVGDHRLGPLVGDDLARFDHPLDPPALEACEDRPNRR